MLLFFFILFFHFFSARETALPRGRSSRCNSGITTGLTAKCVFSPGAACSPGKVQFLVFALNPPHSFHLRRALCPSRSTSLLLFLAQQSRVCICSRGEEEHRRCLNSAAPGSGWVQGMGSGVGHVLPLPQPQLLFQHNLGPLQPQRAWRPQLPGWLSPGGLPQGYTGIPQSR